MPSRGAYWKQGGLVNSTVTSADIVDLTVTNEDIANSTIQANKISYFKSTEQTGDGTEQSIAHGLGRVPALVIVVPTNSSDTTAYTFVEGTHTSTNVLVTATTGAKYKVIAL
jgi:hypothetical protein